MRTKTDFERIILGPREQAVSMSEEFAFLFICDDDHEARSFDAACVHRRNPVYLPRLVLSFKDRLPCWWEIGPLRRADLFSEKQANLIIGFLQCLKAEEKSYNLFIGSERGDSRAQAIADALSYHFNFTTTVPSGNRDVFQVMSRMLRKAPL